VGEIALNIRVFGELQVLWGDRPAPLPASKKARALLGYLVVTGRQHSRERLAELLWDAPDDPRAQLRWCLWKVKPLLTRGSASHLSADRESVAFDPSDTQVDLLRLRSLLAGGVERATTSGLEEAAACFRGELLEGLDLPHCYRYREWCVGERESLRALQVAVLSALVARLSAAPEAALRHARAWVAIDPLREEGHVEVVRLLGQLGRTREALAQYDGCRRILETDLGARPSARLEQARSALSRSPLPAVAARSAPARAPRPQQDAIPFAGRMAERALLGSAVAVCAAGEAVTGLMFVGEPGIGKTRLLEEVGRCVRESGGLVLAGRAFEGEQFRPYGAWIDAFRSAGDPSLEHLLRSSLGPPALDGTPGASAPLNRDRLLEGVVEVLARLRAERPIAVILDDIQWLDEVSTSLLHYAVRSPACEGILFACAARAGELGDNGPCLRAIRALARERRLEEVALGPLDQRATGEIVNAIGADLDAARVFDETEGNPLFTLEVARALSRGDGALSETLEQLIGDRLALLDERTREVLPWVACFGRHISPERLEKITEIPLPHVLSVLDALERFSIVRAVGDDSYDFTHDLIRQVAYQRVPPPRRRLLHLRIARGLAAIAAGDGSVAGQMARHAAEGGDSALCVSACVRAGEHCLRVFAFAEAEAMADLGRHHLARLPKQERIRQHVALLKILIHPGVRLHRPEGLPAEVAAVMSAAQEAGLLAEVTDALHLFGWLNYMRWGGLPRARAHALKIVELVEKLPAPQNLGAIASSARCLAFLEVHMPKARAMFDELAAYGPVAVESLHFQWGLGLVRRWEGDADGARKALATAVRLAREQGDRWVEFECMAALAVVELESSDAAAAAEISRELGPLGRKLGDGGTEGPFAEALAALAAAAKGAAGSAETLEAAINALAKMDAQYILAYVLNAAAEIDLSAQRWRLATERAGRALAAARIASRTPELARAHILLAAAAVGRGETDAAREHLRGLEPDDWGQLGHYARARLDGLMAICGLRQP
jgi:DNA-binding SARP family transcriptional activator/tetratricopeptide (TPR) repeat protein